MSGRSASQGFRILWQPGRLRVPETRCFPTLPRGRFGFVGINHPYYRSTVPRFSDPSSHPDHHPPFSAFVGGLAFRNQKKIPLSGPIDGRVDQRQLFFPGAGSLIVADQRVRRSGILSNEPRLVRQVSAGGEEAGKGEGIFPKCCPALYLHPRSSHIICFLPILQSSTLFLATSRGGWC